MSERGVSILCKSIALAWVLLLLALKLWLYYHLLFGALAHSAPAPLPRREPRSLLSRMTPPVFCTMVWGGSRWRTFFHPDGTYTATIPNSSTWHGTWNIRPGEQGQPVLHVRERIGEGGWVEWSVSLLDAIGPSGGKTNGGHTEVRIEVGGKADN